MNDKIEEEKEEDEDFSLYEIFNPWGPDDDEYGEDVYISDGLWARADGTFYSDKD